MSTWRSTASCPSTLAYSVRGARSACQTPLKSGLPLRRGGGAVKLGLPSLVRGVRGSGWFTHCAETPAAEISIIATTPGPVRIMGSPGRVNIHPTVVPRGEVVEISVLGKCPANGHNHVQFSDIPTVRPVTP